MKSESKNYYQILGLSPNASIDDIRKAYRTYAAKFHPDKHEGDPFFEDRFKEVKEAYEILSDTETRWRYDIKKFGKSKVVVKTNPDDFETDTKGERESETKHGIRIDVTHLDIYLTAFYFINLGAWVIIKKMNEHAAPGGYAWGFFLTTLSSLLLWFFVSGLIARIKRRQSGPWSYRMACLLIALALTYVLLRTSWTP